jgi:NADH-quinone oxidoreductase subunit C
MTPDELAAHLTEATGVVERHEVAHAELSVWVAPDDWRASAQHLKDCGRCHFDFCTFLTAVDAEEQGFEIVLHVYSIRRQHHINLKTFVPREHGSIPTLSDVWLGCNWCERETAELFGIGFEGHPNLVTLLLPDGFEGHPLRKDFVLMSREAKDFPGDKEPEEVR